MEKIHCENRPKKGYLDDKTSQYHDIILGKRAFSPKTI